MAGNSIDPTEAAGRSRLLIGAISALVVALAIAGVFAASSPSDGASFEKLPGFGLASRDVDEAEAAWVRLAASPSPSPTPRPCAGVPISPGRSIQAAIDANPEGTVFCLKAGVHRLGSRLVPKSRQQFVGEAGAVVTGARLLTSWTPEGSVWRAAVPLDRSPGGKVECNGGYLCDYNEDVTYDDRFLRRVGSRGEVGPGRYFIDYSSDVVYLGDNPAGHEVEVAVAGTAFYSYATGVRIRGLTVEKFANPGQWGAIVDGGGGWVIEDNEVRLNHGIGICAFHGKAVIRSNYVHHNGEMGLCGQKDGLLVEGNEIAFNAPQVVGFNVFWEGGGTKFVDTQNLIVRRNYSHDNRGPGLWTDSNNVNTIYENNRAVNNTDAGILHEISCAAVIRGNYASGNGFDRVGNSSFWGGGIVVWQSPDVEIHSNTVVDNKHGIMAIQTPRGSGACGTFEVRNLWVHDNTLRQVAAGRAAGLALYKSSDTTYYLSKNNRFDANSYSLGRDASFWWMNGSRTASEWVSSGNDTRGRFSRA